METAILYAQRRDDDLARVSWPHLACPQGDTLVIVDFPYNSTCACNGSSWPGVKKLLMDKEKLLATGSSVFVDGFSDENQRRYHRRNKLELLPDGVKYVLDLTPSLEGDDAAFLVSDLSLPAGARDWWLSKERLGVALSLVSGHDDVCANHGQIPDDCPKVMGWTATQQSVNVPRKWNICLDLDACCPCPEREIQDYCAVRHRANIIRILMVIAGHDLVLDSAPRVYTIASLAKQLDVIDLVSSPVRAWLQDHRNSSFVDVHPEITIELAWKLRLQDLVRSALRILVVERAFEPAEVQTERSTLFGRPRSDLSDDISEVVQHATNSLRERCKKTAAGLFSPKVYEWLRIPAWDEFLKIGRYLEADTTAMIARRTGEQHEVDIIHHYFRVQQILRNFMRDVVENAASTSTWDGRDLEIDNDRKAYASNPNSLYSIRTDMNNEQVMLLPFFWRRLMDDTLDWQEFCNYKASTSENGLPIPIRDHVNGFVSNTNCAMSYGSFPSLRARYPYGLAFTPKGFHNQLSQATKRLWHQWAPYSDDIEVPLHRTTHIALGLTDDEFKFLPLWAGGLDDETGGVFDNMIVPDTDMGPNQPGPGYHTGRTIAAPSSTTESDITVVGGGVSLRAVESDASASAVDSVRSQTTASFVEMASSLGVRSFDELSDSHDGATSIGDTLGNLGIFSDSGMSDIVGFEGSVAAASDDSSMADDPLEDDDNDDKDDEDKDANDVNIKTNVVGVHAQVGDGDEFQNTTTETGEVVTDGDDFDDFDDSTMDDEDEWSDLG